jgi:biofilm PGA synthesis N-glycosyltransferase PgaC
MFFDVPYRDPQGEWRMVSRTLAEDMDLTWGFYEKGYGVRFIPEAVCYPIEPHNYTFMRKQLRRWSHGFVQNVMIHWRDILRINYLRTFIAVAAWDAVVASLAYLFLIPLIAIVFNLPILLIGYVIDIPVILIPVLSTARKRKEVLRALASLPSFLSCER